jgi:acetyl esterase
MTAAPAIDRRLLLAPDVLAVVEAGEAAGGPPAHELPAERQRARHAREAAALAGPGPEVAAVRDFAIAGPHGRLGMRAYTPAGAATAGDLPVIAYFHGGGWVVGSVDSFDPVARTLANASGAQVVSVDYRLAPEHRFPVPVDEAVAAVEWLADRAPRVAVAGDSAGANLAAVAAQRLRERIAAQALIYPVTDAAFDTPSSHEFASGFGFSRAAMERYWELYLAGADGEHPDASPLRGDLAGLPPAFVVTAACDVLRDEGEAYARELNAAGTRATLRRCPGTVHGFWRWLTAAAASRQAIGEVGAALRAALA